MRPAVVHRPWFALGVSLYEEASEVGYYAIDFLYLTFPPRLHRFVGGVGSGQSAEGFGRGEVYRQIYAYAVLAQHVCNALCLLQLCLGEHQWLGVDVVEHGAVDAYGGVGAPVFLYYGEVCHAIRLPEDAAPGISALHRAIGIVPVVEQAQGVGVRRWLCGRSGSLWRAQPQGVRILRLAP